VEGSINVPIYKKGDKTDCNNFRGIPLLSTVYKILYNILLARLTPYVNEIIGDNQCGFRRNRSTRDQIFYMTRYKKRSGIIVGRCISYFLTSIMTQLR
jgi:hypothetical protein